MNAVVVALLAGALVGFLVGWYCGKWHLLHQMHLDDIEKAHATHRERKRRYLKRKKASK